MCLGWHSFVRAVGLGVKNCLVLCKKKVHRSSVFHFCLFVLNFLYFSFPTSFSLVLLCISGLVLYHFEAVST